MDHCPLLNKKCIREKCKFWVHIAGMHPQNGTQVDMFDCAVRWLPTLLIENAKETRQAAGAIESQRNETAKVAGVFQSLFRPRQIGP